MPLALHDLTSLYLSSLITLRHLISTAQIYSSSSSTNTSSSPSTSIPLSHLAPDMNPLSHQVHKATSIAKAGLYQIIPSRSSRQPTFTDFPTDGSTTISDLITRCDETITLLRSVTKDELAGKEDAIIETTLGTGQTIRKTGKEITLEVGVPNVMFHVAMAYAILRKEGVPLRKGDWVGGFANSLGEEEA